MQMQDIEIAGQNVQALVGEPQDRNFARFKVLRSIASNLEDYRPLQAHGLPSNLKAYLTQFETFVSVLGANNYDNELAVAFRSWRSDVTDLEANNQRRLTVLVGAIQVLHAMREEAENVEPIDELLQPLSYLLAGAWRLQIPEPREVDGGKLEPVNMRNWLSRVTRRYDLLPRDWREL